MKVRILLLSKLRKLLLFVAMILFLAHHSLSAGGTDIEYHPGLQEMTLLEAIHHISDQYQVLFNYDRAIVSDIKVNYAPVAGHNVDEAIMSVLKNTDLKYQMFNHRYVVIYKNDQEGIESLKEMIHHFQKIVDDKDQEIVTSRQMEHVSRLITTLPHDLLNRKALAFSIQGTVVDQEGEPLIGVNIQIKGSNKGTATDVKGHFALEDIDENAVLVVSYIGYQTQEVPIAGKSTLNITLISDTQLLDEVVVVGYGTQKKVNVIGSVTSIDEKEITASPISKLSNALAGRLPGAIFMQDGGEPGNDEASILIRGNSTLGSNSPLVVVDGIPGRDINSLHPNDIESISVLKDASAAIYGARAANGVILVTTKRGTYNVKPKLTYGYFEGVLSPTMLPELTDAPTYAQMIRENQSYRGVDESNMLYSEEDIEKFRSGNYPWTHPNTDWYDMALKDFSSTRHHDLSISGGSESISYFASFGKQFDDGIYTNSLTSYDRYNVRANLDFKLNDYITIGLDISGIQENSIYPTKSASAIFRSLRRSYPTQAALFPNGLPGPDIEFGDQPMVSASDATGFDDRKEYRSNNVFSANIKIPWIEGLSASGYFAYDTYNRKRKLFQKPWTLYSFDKDSYLADGNTGIEDGSDYLVGTKRGFSEPRVTNYSNNNIAKTFNLKVDYNTTLAQNHNLSAFVAYEQYEGNSGGFTAYRRYFVSDRLPYLFAGGDEGKDNDESVGIGARQNYFGRVSYNFKETYLFQFSYRRDGSLNFSKEAGRWGNFPSVLVGWRPSQEAWWQNNIQFVNYFKLKASWGQLGNDIVSPFQYLTRYGFTTGVPLGASKGYVQGLEQRGFPNPNITWEVANVYNFGWESQFLNSRIGFDTDFFFERRNNILVKRNRSVPEFTGISLPDENYGIVENYGFEFQLHYNKPQGIFNYFISANMAYAKNKIVEFDEPARSVPWQVRTGLPQGTQLLYHSIGIFRDEEQVNSLPHVTGAKPGDIIIEDVDGDGEITSDDRKLFPLTTIPKLTFGLNLNFSYKNWELRGLVQGHGRALRYIYDDSRAGSAGNYFQYDAEDRWTPTNKDASKPRAYEWTEEYWRDSHITDYHYTDISYARLKNLQLSYQLPEALISKVGLKETRLYVSGQNLWLIYSGNKIMDPEAGGMGAYPIMKVLSLGGQITF
ncbi:TonB-dependent receptor [Membranicola marinus]|uniref:TonB-dependent receptor n=1 Tax=Membranihabitans marinus TaxID=1227546 RepID=A0A953HWR1_9BACT|nr:TonB-dependent receptor [Membranihabitans marinus]MBY5959650.1 TonB-dependent receptor [Membranihabitans marinus]